MLNAAWISDDKEHNECAIRYRKKTIELFDKGVKFK